MVSLFWFKVVINDKSLKSQILIVLSHEVAINYLEPDKASPLIYPGCALISSCQCELPFFLGIPIYYLCKSL